MRDRDLTCFFSLSFSLSFLETGSYYVTYAGLELLGLRDSPTTASQGVGTINTCYNILFTFHLTKQFLTLAAHCYNLESFKNADT
jgi:hypothetical protein